LEKHRFKQQDRNDYSLSVFARLGPRNPPKHKMIHTVKRKTSKTVKTKIFKKELDRALDDYMKEGDRTKKKKLDEELSQYVAERKTDVSNQMNDTIASSFTLI
jgi:hypothetical protein